MSAGRCENFFARAANSLIMHPKATVAGLVTIVAIAALAALIAHGVPLDGAAGRALIFGLTAGSIGLGGLTYLMKKHDDKANKKIVETAANVFQKTDHEQVLPNEVSDTK